MNTEPKNPVDEYVDKNYRCARSWSGDGKLPPLGMANSASVMNWGNPGLREKDGHLYLECWNTYRDPDMVDQDGVEWDLFDADTWNLRVRQDIRGAILLGDLNGENFLRPRNGDGTLNKEWSQSPYHIVYMRNRQTTEIVAMVFKFSTDGYCCVDS